MLLELVYKYPILEQTLKATAIAPTDKMNMDACLDLINFNIATVLDSIASTTTSSTDKDIALAIKEFISRFAKYYTVMAFDDDSIEKKLEILCGEQQSDSQQNEYVRLA